MDRNFVQNQHEPTVWQTLFRPHRVSVMTQQHNLNLSTGKPGPGFPSQQNRGSGTTRPRPRINLLRLNSQGEDNRSPPIHLSSECTFYHPEINFYQDKKISMIKMRRARNDLNHSRPRPIDWCGECPRPSPATHQGLPDELNSITEEVVGLQQEKTLQNSNSQLRSKNDINLVSHVLRFATIMPNKNKMQNTEMFTNAVPLTRGLPYFRPTIPVGLSASAILFGRYEHAERSVSRTNPFFMQANMSPEFKKKSEMCSSINVSLSLAKSELSKLINQHKITMNQQLPQIRKVKNSESEDVGNDISLNSSTITNNIKPVEMKQKSCEQLNNYTEPLSGMSVRQDYESDGNQNEVISSNLRVDDSQTENHSSCYSSDVSDLDNNEEEKSVFEEEDDEEEDSDRDSNSSGSLSDFESDTESYDASSEYESDSDLDSDTESWSSDVKEPVPSCQNAIVSFILGQSSDAAGGKDSGFDEGDEPSIDASENQDQVDGDQLWCSLNASGDPFNPINGWKCCSGSPFQITTTVGQQHPPAKEQNSNHTLPKLHSDDAKPNCLISKKKEDTKLYKNEDAAVKQNNVALPGVDKMSCPIKCLNYCTWSANESNLNNTVNEIDSVDKSAATKIDVAKSCFKNTRQQEEKHTKKVSFSCKDVSLVAYENPDWCDDYRDMRKPYWESFARDRCRFHRRIQEISDAISYCFERNHRRKMMKKLQITD